MEEPRKLVVFCLIVLATVVDDLFGDAASVRKIALNEPRYILGRKFSQVHVLTNSGPVSADYWTFYVPPKFVLNLAFINYTAETSSTSTYCKEHFASVTVFNAEHGTSHTLPPYCGQKRNGIKVNGTVGIHLVKSGFSGGISMTVVTEPSTKNCGGFFSNSSVGMPLNFNLHEFPSKDTLIHCTWFFEFQTSQTLRFLISRMVLLHDATPLCSYYKEFIAIRSLDERTGEEKNVFLQCKPGFQTLPMVLSQIASRKFAITVHTERTVVWKVGIVNGVCFFETKGKEGALIEVYAPGKRPLAVTSQANTTGSIINTLFLLKPKYSGTQVFFVLNNLEPVCIRGKIDAWTIVNSYLGRVPDLCKTLESNGLMSGKVDTMFAIHIHGELRHLERAMINYFPTNAGCGGVFSLAHGQRQIIASPMTASRSYPANTYCQWSFVASSNTFLNITITSMDLEPCFTTFSDYVEIFSGFRTPLQLHYKICHIPATEMKILGDMTIRFYSDDILQMDGFVMIVTAYNGGESTTRIPDVTSMVTNEVPRPSTSVTTVIKTEFTKFSSKKTTKTKKPCCKSTSSLTNSIASRKHRRQSTTAVVKKKTVNGRVALSSNNLNTISIAFGAGAVIIVVIIIILLKRRKRANPSYSKSNNTSSNNFDTDTGSRIIHRDKKSFCEQYPLENIYSNPSDESAKVAEKPPDVIYANTMSCLPAINRSPESGGAIVYETMNAQPIKESEQIPDQYICPDSQQNKSGDNQTCITYEAMNGLEVPRSSSNNINSGVYVNPSKL